MEKTPSFNNASPERPVSDAEKIRSYLKSEQEKLALEFREKQKELLPEEQITIAPDFRIEPPSKIYQEGHKRAVGEHLRMHRGSSNPTEISKDENERAGFMFEMLKTSIMHKKAGSRFIVVRSSHYDDVVNKVDNVLVDRKTGQTVCALDEVSPRSMQDDEARKKRQEIKMRNFGYAAKSEGFDSPRQVEVERGMTLQYGIELANGKIACKELHHLPIFLLSLDHKHLNEGLKQFQNSDKPSEYENKLFRYFLSSFSLQIQEFKLDSKEYEHLPADMLNRIESLEVFLKEQGAR